MKTIPNTGFYRAGEMADTSLYIVENLLKGIRHTIDAGNDLPMDRIEQAIIQLTAVKNEAKFYASIEEFETKNPQI